MCIVKEVMKRRRAYLQPQFCDFCHAKLIFTEQAYCLPRMSLPRGEHFLLRINGEVIDGQGSIRQLNHYIKYLPFVYSNAFYFFNQLIFTLTFIKVVFFCAKSSAVTETQRHRVLPLAHQEQKAGPQNQPPLCETDSSFFFDTFLYLLRS